MSRLLPSVSPLSRREIEGHATQTLARHYPGLLIKPGPFPVIEFFELLEDVYGLEPGVEELPQGTEGITWPDGRVIVSEETYRGAVHDNGRCRFTVVHEAYHGLRHRTQLKTSLIHFGSIALHRRQEIPAYRNPEWQANVFAGATLMPAPMVRLLAANVERWDLVNEMMDSFKTSRQAAEVRLSQLGV